MEKINNKKLIPVYAILGTLGLIWFFLIGIPSFNSLFGYINSKVPAVYKLPIALSVIIVISLSFAFITWRYIAPKLKELSSSKFDKPSLAVVMSGSSGSGIFRAFKAVTDLRFASVIKGIVFDVERETQTTFNEGAIHALRFPVQAAKTGFKGAVGARRIEYEKAKKAFDQFFKPFAKKINSIVRITGIGRGYTSISTTTNFDFIDFSRFPGGQSTTLFDLIVVDRLENAEENTISHQQSLSVNKDLEKSIYRISVDGVNQGAVRYSDSSFIVTALDSLRDPLGNIKNFLVLDSRGNEIENRLEKIDDQNHLAIIKCEGLAEVHDSNIIETDDLDDQSSVSIVELSAANSFKTVNSKIDSINKEIGILKVNTSEEDIEIGSLIVSSNKVAGIVLATKPGMTLAISSMKIKDSVQDLIKNQVVLSNTALQTLTTI